MIRCTSSGVNTTGSRLAGLARITPSMRSSGLLENVLVEEEQSAERLVLRGRRDVAVDGEIAQEVVNFGFRHFDGMAFAVEQDELPGPVVVGVLGANGVVADAAGVAKAIEEFGFGHGMTAGNGR